MKLSRMVYKSQKTLSPVVGNKAQKATRRSRYKIEVALYCTFLYSTANTSSKILHILECSLSSMIDFKYHEHKKEISKRNTRTYKRRGYSVEVIRDLGDSVAL